MEELLANIIHHREVLEQDNHVYEEYIRLKDAQAKRGEDQYWIAHGWRDKAVRRLAEIHETVVTRKRLMQRAREIAAGIVDNAGVTEGELLTGDLQPSPNHVFERIESIIAEWRKSGVVKPSVQILPPKAR
jgi:hypothetical protein